jgi:triacylglycerol lipase
MSRARMTGSFALPLLASALIVALASACGSAGSVQDTARDAGDSGVKLTSELPTDAGVHDAAAHDAPKTPYMPAGPVAPPPNAKAHGPYPIVLMHGMGGFNQLANLPLTVSYFNGVQADLKAHGESEVFLTIAPPFNTSEVRAQSIAPQLDAILKMTGAAKLNLIGHSQGGMDARILVSPAGMGYGNRVASVTTIATPHRGTKVADLVLGLTTGPLSGAESSAANAFLSILQQGVYTLQSDPDLLAQVTELSTAYATDTFNTKYTDDPSVTYASYAGRSNLETGNGDCDDGVYANQPGALDIPQPELQPTASYLSLEGETSDGLVPVTSAKWGTFMECVPADHLKECGMLLQNGPDPVSGFDHLVFFRAVVARLRAEGF